jgi:hypothetical protein
MKFPEFASRYKISFSHLYAIEKGIRVLNQKTAERIATGVRQEGYICSASWLLTGEGDSPLVHEQVKNDLNENDGLISTLSVELKIMKETNLFRSLYKDSIVSCVLDDGMEPFYGRGDYVGGILSTTIKEGIGKDCIVITKEGEQVIRKLLKGTKKGLFTVSCINPNTKESRPILYDISIESIAPIVWHRRREY